MRKTIQALREQADATLEDNTTQAITAADVRAMIKDVVDTFCPGFGAVGNPSVTLSIGTTPVVIPYAQLLAVTVEFTANLPAGTVQRKGQGLPSTNTRVTFYADIAPAGQEVVFGLYRDAEIVPGGTTASGRASFEVINGVAVAGDPVYSVRASKVSGTASDVTLSNVRLILEVVPTIGV